MLFNKLDINWDKTYFMFVTNKRLGKKIPTVIPIDNSAQGIHTIGDIVLAASNGG